jgi:hypothetical protein
MRYKEALCRDEKSYRSESGVECRHSLVELSLIYSSSVLDGIHLVYHQNDRQRLSVR